MKLTIKDNAKKSIKWLAIVGLLLPVSWLGYASLRSVTTDFERLQWLCSDYQLPVAGYVIEGWFQTVHMPGMKRFLEHELHIVDGIHRVALDDGSILTTVMQRKEDKWQIELQLIATTRKQAAQYYSLWQRFADRYSPNHPIGVTVVAELPETMDMTVSGKLIQELAEGLALEPNAFITETHYQQLSGFSNQLQHKIDVNGVPTNSSITVVPAENKTCLYLASPLLYQQI